MPELPEVEVTLRGIAGVLEDAVISRVKVNNFFLREKINEEVVKLSDLKVKSLSRRAKYIIIETDKGCLLIHLGMTGHLLVCDSASDLKKHDHVEIILSNHKEIRFNDQRRFGLFLWFENMEQLQKSRYIASLGPEPLESSFTASVLYNELQNHKKKPIKQALMDNAIVVGIGNIYASEVLFSCGIHPKSLCGNIPIEKCEQIVRVIKETLLTSISRGATTIRDFSGADGKLGYFVQNLHVYGKEGEPCPVCHKKIDSLKMGGRSTFFCPSCQKIL